jgi:hypothetical protein
MDNFLVANPINRFGIGERNDLIKNPNGSLDIFIQRDSSGEEKSRTACPKLLAGGSGLKQKLDPTRY